MNHNSKFFDNFGQFIFKFPEANLTDLFSKGQIDSKRWLVNELIKLDVELGTVFLCAGWYGLLATFLFESGLKIEKIRSFDIDPNCADCADSLNRSWVINNWKFKATTEDILNINYENHIYSAKRFNGTYCQLSDVPDTIINTSCEHIKEFNIWYNKIPNNKLIILQSNNYTEIVDHVNTSNTLEEFSKTVPMIETLFEGKLELEKYIRFMKIGIK